MRQSAWCLSAVLVAITFCFGCSSATTPPTASIAAPGGESASPAVGRTVSSAPPSQVRLKTTAGDIVIRLDHAAAPKTVENFLGYVRDGFYDQTIVHHAAAGMIIAGGLTTDMVYKPTRIPVINEAANGRAHKRGTVALARLPEDADSGTSQFFINLTDNPLFNHQNQEHAGYGYAVFGEVIEGLEIAEKIGKGPTHTVGEFAAVPEEPVIVQAAVEELLR